ncbi:MAG: serine/threonine-protein kinase [Acidobacteriota bacterium]
MSYEFERRVFAILDEVLDAESGARADLLNRLCGDDAALRAEVESLAEAEPGGLLAAPAFDVHAEGDGGASRLGRTIGDYKLIELLGRGGMGTVYLSERQAFDQRVALKIIRRGLDLDPVLVQRFENERQMLAHLEHPGIARLLDGGATADGLRYLAMEHIDGVPLDTYCQSHGLGLRARLELFVKVLDAVGYAHRNLIVHRDLKPGNILVDAEGQPKLLDFGIAKVLDDGLAASPLHTATGESPMTPRYASPEQIRRQPITTGADVYVLGVLLFELITGVSAYGTDDPAELPQWVCEREVERPSTAVRRRDGGWTGTEPNRLRRRLAGDLDAIVAKALRKSPTERYASVDALAEDLRRHLDGLPVEARRGDTRYRVGKFVSRHRVAINAALTLLTSLGALAYFSFVAQEETRRLASRTDFMNNLIASPTGSLSALGATERAVQNEQRLFEAGRLDEREMVARADFAGRFGLVMWRGGNHAQALLAMEAAHDWANRVFGPAGPETLKQLNNRAAVLSSMGRYDESLALFRRAVQDIEAIEVDERRTFRPRSNLATMLKNQGELDEALEVHLDVLERRRALYSDDRDDKDITTSRHNVAAVYYAKGGFERARAFAQQALDSRRRNKKNSKSSILNTQVLLGQSLTGLGRNAEAVAELEDALSGRITKPQDNLAQKTAIAQRHLAEALHATDPECAEHLAELAIETFRRGPEAWRLAEAQSLLASWRPATASAVEQAELWAAQVAEVRGADSTPARRAWNRAEALERRLSQQ